MSNPKRKLFDDHPELIGWWSCNNTLDPDKLSKGSTKRALWWCGKHEWPAVVQNMVKGSRCPYCSGNLAIVYSYKDVRIDRRYAKDLPDEELHLVHDSGSVRYVREANPYIG